MTWCPPYKFELRAPRTLGLEAFIKYKKGVSWVFAIAKNTSYTLKVERFILGRRFRGFSLQPSKPNALSSTWRQQTTMQVQSRQIHSA